MDPVIRLSVTKIDCLTKSYCAVVSSLVFEEAEV